jgi:hypothetical protein
MVTTASKSSLKPSLSQPKLDATPKSSADKVPAKVPAKVSAKVPAKAPAKVPAKAQVTTKTSPRKTVPKVLKTEKIEKTQKVKKPKMVREGFSMPKNEYEILSRLKVRAAKMSYQVKKSELLRAGIKALEAMNDAAFASSLAAVLTLKGSVETKK